MKFLVLVFFVVLCVGCAKKQATSREDFSLTNNNQTTELKKLLLCCSDTILSLDAVSLENSFKIYDSIDIKNLSTKVYRFTTIPSKLVEYHSDFTGILNYKSGVFYFFKPERFILNAKWYGHFTPFLYDENDHNLTSYYIESYLNDIDTLLPIENKILESSFDSLFRKVFSITSNSCSPDGNQIDCLERITNSDSIKIWNQTNKFTERDDNTILYNSKMTLQQKYAWENIVEELEKAVEKKGFYIYKTPNKSVLVVIKLYSRHNESKQIGSIRLGESYMLLRHCIDEKENVLFNKSNWRINVFML